MAELSGRRSVAEYVSQGFSAEPVYEVGCVFGSAVAYGDRLLVWPVLRVRVLYLLTYLLTLYTSCFTDIDLHVP